MSYTDIKTERQWKVLPKYAAGEKYEDFKLKVMDCYDGTRDSDRDAVQELKRLVRCYDIAQISDKSQFMEFKREFQVLASALSKVLSNRELVDTFLAPMSNELYRSIKLQLERLPVPAGLIKRGEHRSIHPERDYGSWFASATRSVLLNGQEER